MMISCADSRVAPEMITQSGPGELFVCRNAGNIVPPLSQAGGSIPAAIEYAVAALEVNDIVICGHSDCGAMKALLNPHTLDELPQVKTWLRHSQAAREVVRETYPSDMHSDLAASALAQENVIAQLNNLRTHPVVAARLAAGRLRLHGWFYELETGTVLALDGALGRFVAVREEDNLPVAVAPSRRVVADAIPATAAP